MSKQRGLAQCLQRECREEQRYGKICCKAWRVAFEISDDVAARWEAEYAPRKWQSYAILNQAGTIQEVETWNDAANHADWEAAGGAEECGGVPYFFNTVTKESVCGAADCETLKKWAISAGLSSNLN